MRRAWTLLVLFAILSTCAAPSLAQSASDIACFLPVGADRDHVADVGMVTDLVELKPLGVVVGASEGLFLVKAGEGGRSVAKSVVDAASHRGTGAVLDIQSLTDELLVVLADQGLFVVQPGQDEAKLGKVDTTDVGDLQVIQVVPNLGVLVGGDNGLFLLGVDTLTLDTAPLVKKRIYAIRAVGPAGYMVGGADGMFWVHADGGELKVEAGADVDTGFVSSMWKLPSGLVLVGARHGTFVATGEKTQAPNGTGDTGAVEGFYLLSDQRLIITSEEGVFVTNADAKKFAIDRVAAVNTGAVSGVIDLGGDTFMVGAKSGAFTLTVGANGGPISMAATNLKQEVKQIEKVDDDHVLAIGGNELFLGTRTASHWDFVEQGDALADDVRTVAKAGKSFLVAARNGLFVIEAGTLKPMPSKALGVVRYISPIGPGLLLVSGSGGRLLVRVVDDQPPVVVSLATAFVGESPRGFRLRANLLIVGGSAGLFESISTPFGGAPSVKNRKELESGPVAQNQELPVTLSFEHDCAAALQRAGLGVRVYQAGGTGETQPLSSSGRTIEPTMRLEASAGGDWLLQIVSLADGQETDIGKPAKINLTVNPWWTQWTVWAQIVAGLLVAANIGLFVAARWSIWAWRVATGGGLSSWVLRWGTFLLSYFAWAQLWVLDNYFQRAKANVTPVMEYASLPLRAPDGTPAQSNQVLAAPWRKTDGAKRTWIKGADESGKTTLFSHVVAQHFASPSARSAWVTWGCVFVCIDVKEFNQEADDEDNPTWLRGAVASSLASFGLKFSDDKLLNNLLDSGTIGVLIDDLHEANRSKAVRAFAREYSAVPMLVTSKGEPIERFEGWSLPGNDQFITEYLAMVMPIEEARVAAAAIKGSRERPTKQVDA